MSIEFRSFPINRGVIQSICDMAPDEGQEEFSNVDIGKRQIIIENLRIFETE